MFPDFWGMQPVEGQDNTALRFPGGVEYPFREPGYASEATPFYVDLGWRACPTGGHGLHNSPRWLDYGGFGGGLSVFCRKWRTWDYATVRTFRSEADPTQLRLLWENKANIPPGAEWDSGEFWLTAYEGGWAKGIEVFRDYVRSVAPARKLPPTVEQTIGFQTIWMIQTAEPDPARAVFRYSGLPSVARDALEHGIREVEIEAQRD